MRRGVVSKITALLRLEIGNMDVRDNMDGQGVIAELAYQITDYLRPVVL